jgi:hypothetical protein
MKLFKALKDNKRIGVVIYANRRGLDLLESYLGRDLSHIKNNMDGNFTVLFNQKMTVGEFESLQRMIRNLPRHATLSVRMTSELIKLHEQRVGP